MADALLAKEIVSTFQKKADVNQTGTISMVELKNEGLGAFEIERALLRHVYGAAVPKQASSFFSFLAKEEGYSTKELIKVSRVLASDNSSLSNEDRILKSELDAALRKVNRLKQVPTNFNDPKTDRHIRGGYSDTCGIIAPLLAIEIIEPETLAKKLIGNSSGVQVSFNDGAVNIKFPSFLEKMQLGEGTRVPLFEKAFIESYYKSSKTKPEPGWLSSEYHGDGFKPRENLEKVSSRLFSENVVAALSTESFHRLFVRIGEEQLPAVIGTKKDTGISKLVPNHAYVVLGVDAQNFVKLVNSEEPFKNGKLNVITIAESLLKDIGTVITWGLKK